MFSHRSLCSALLIALVCGTALAEPQTASEGLSQTIFPHDGQPAVPPIDGVKPPPDPGVPEIFPQVASAPIATETAPPIMHLPASGAVQAQAATHPQAHESTPLLPSTLTSGWMLMSLASSTKPIPFMDVPGFRATYQLPGKDGTPQEFIADILMIASESEALEAYDLLASQDTLATTTDTLQLPGLKKILFREGMQDSPAASAQAPSIKTTRISAWFPPFVILFQGQNISVGPLEVKDILSSLSWRE